MKKIYFYPGRFQPMGPHHADVFSKIMSDYDAESIGPFIVTSDKVELPKSPLNFNEKKQVMMAHGIPGGRIIQVSNPYYAKEVLFDYDPSEVEAIYLVGAKDMAENPRFQKTEGITKEGYKWSIEVAPHIERNIEGEEMSGTTLRKTLANADEETFYSIMGFQDKKIYDLLTQKFSQIEEDFYDPRNKTVDFMRSSEWKAGYKGKKDIPRKGDQIHNRQKTRGVVFEQETVNCTCLPGDLNGDGDVDILDAGILENILLGAQNINEVACIGNLPTQANGNFNYMTSIILENLILGQGPTANEYIESGNFYNLNAPSEVVASFTAMGCVPNEEDICDNFENSIPVNVSDFCTKCETNSWVNSGYEQYCECCKIPLKDKPKKEPNKNPLKLKESRGGESEMHIYDFDETIARAETPIPYEVKSPKGETIESGETTSVEFESKREELENEYDEGITVDYNFDAFKKLIGDATLNNEVFQKLLESIKNPNAKVTILTARSVGYPVTQFLKEQGIWAYVVPLGLKVNRAVTGQDKADWIDEHIKDTTKKVIFIDDSDDNKEAVSMLSQKYSDIEFDIQDPPPIDEMMMGTMNNQEKAKHAKNLKRLKKDLKKQGNQYIKVPNYLNNTLKISPKVHEQFVPKIHMDDDPYRHKEMGHYTTNVASINGNSIPLEVMGTPEDQITGMMGRNELKGGMIFPYDEVSKKDFHMEGCLIPLDIVFINKGTIGDIHSDCPPCKTLPCPKYSGMADNVLELPGGYCKNNNINIGDKVNLNLTESKIKLNEASAGSSKLYFLCPDQFESIFGYSNYYEWAGGFFETGSSPYGYPFSTMWTSGANPPNHPHILGMYVSIESQLNSIETSCSQGTIEEDFPNLVDGGPLNDYLCELVPTLINNINSVSVSQEDLIASANQGSYTLQDILHPDVYHYCGIGENHPYWDLEDYPESWIYGCTLGNADNYNPAANTDDGSCCSDTLDNLPMCTGGGYPIDPPNTDWDVQPTSQTGTPTEKPVKPIRKKPAALTKEWWSEMIKKHILTEGGAAGHMAHPFNLPNVNSGKDLKDIFDKAADSLKVDPGSVKIDGVNSSIRLVDIEGEKQFVMDRGSKMALDVKGITKDDLETRFKPGHGMIEIGGAVLDMFNEALPSIKDDLEKLGAWDNPNILFNMEYVSGKTNVQDYGSNFIAIHGLNQIELDRTETGNRESKEISYDKSAFQSLLDNLAPTAKEKGFEMYGSVPTEMTKDPDFSSALSQNYTIISNEGEKSQTLDAWLNELNNIPEKDFIFMNVDNSKKKIGAVSKLVYTTLLKGGNIDELFENEEDKKKAIEGFTTYLATEKLGDEVLKVLDSPMGSVDNHEGVVIRDENIANVPFKITGKFILGGMTSDF